MVTDEIVAYLGAAGLGLVPGTNIFDVPFPMDSPDACSCVVAYGHQGEPLDTFGPSLGPVVAETPVVQIQSRDTRDNAAAARSQSLAIYQQLRNLTQTPLGAVLYYHIRARSQPLFLKFDGNQRPVYYVEYEVMKAESAA